MDDSRYTLGRRLMAAIVLVLITAYSLGVISGRVHKDNRLQLADLALIGLACAVGGLLLNPNVISRLRVVELQGFKVELLEKVRERQLQQAQDLEDIQLIIPLLLPDTERKHLKNLARRTRVGYKGNHSLRTELRRLRSIGLVRMRSNRAIADLGDGVLFDLGDYLALTELGERWVRRLEELDEPPDRSNDSQAQSEAHS
jgi:hypothetical protein